MGGHGAMICALTHPTKYRSISAFAPICHPSECPWGIKAFSGYLGENNKDHWRQYDTVELIKSGHKFGGPVLVDQGESDTFLTAGQLLPDDLATVCRANNLDLKLQMHKDYDHSYYFIFTFMDSHLEFHAKNLCHNGAGK